MSTVDERIVSMKFNNSQFEPGVKSSLGLLDRLKSALNFTGADKGLKDIQNSANRFSLQGMANATQGISSKFLAMSTVAITALANITNKAVDAGIKIIKALTLDPAKDGFEEYETNLNAVQTILANTQASGATLKDVNRTLQELNTYSDKTIYNFSEMAKNIGTFTAAGVDLKTASASIKGIANLAALSGSNSQQASTAMYQLSQAISAGRVSLQDWNSVVNAGLGGTVFQRALAQNAERLGTLSKGAVELKGKMKNVTIAGQSFRESITAKPGEKSWLTSKVLTDTLKQFTGDMTDAELAASGFNKSQIRDIQAQAKTAQNAATQVKTFTQLIGTLQESAGSGYAQTFQILLGDFEEAKKLFTEVNNIAGGFIGKSAKARNEMLQAWKDLGGRRALLLSFRDVFHFILDILKPISEAFREIFPPTTGKQLYDLTIRFLHFTENLKIGAKTTENLKRTFRGVFAALDIGVQVVKGVLGVLGKLFGLLGKGSGGFLEFTGDIGDFVVKVDQAIKKGDLITKFFQKFGQVLALPIEAAKAITKAIVGLFDGWSPSDAEGISESLGRIADRFRVLGAVPGKVAAAFKVLFGVFQKVKTFLQPAIDAISQAFSGVVDAIAEAFKAGDFSSVFDALNTGLLAGIVLLLKKFLDGGIKVDFGGGFLGTIKETFEGLTSALSAMQAQVQSKTLLQIAIAVAALTASIVALSLIDSTALTKSLTALTVAFAQLMVAMTILTKISGSAGFLKVPSIAAAMILLSTAVLILTAAVRNLSGLSWEELLKGLGGVGALLLGLVLVAKGLEKSSGSILRAGLAMVPLAIGIKILASAVKDFGQLSVGEIAKSLIAMGGALLIVAGAISLMPKTMIVQAAGLVVLSIALKGIASALADLGGMSVAEIAKSLVTLAGSLLIIAGGLALMTAALPGAAALIVAAGALLIMAPALETFSKFSWESIGKIGTVLAGALLILAGGLTLMTAALPGAVALGVATTALAALAPVLIVLGAMSWESIGKGLVALAGAFAVLGVAGLVLTPIIPSILGLAAALVILGAGFALVGVGALAVASAFSIFAAAGAAGIATLTGMIGLIPAFLSKFAEGIIGFATTLASQASKFTKAFFSLLNALLDAVIQVTPKIGVLINKLVVVILNILVTNIPKISNAGFKLLLGLLTAIRDNIQRVVPVVFQIITKFIGALGDGIPRVLQAGAKFIIKFLNGLADTIRENSDKMRAAAGRVAAAIISGMTGGLSDGAYKIANAAVNAARDALNAAKNFLGIHSPSRAFYEIGAFSAEGQADGWDDNGRLVVRAAEDVARNALTAVQDQMRKANEFDGLNLNPTVTPILDLSKLTKDATQISNVLGRQTLTPDFSYQQASSIADQRTSQSDNAAPAEGSGNVYLSYEQNINAPKAPNAVAVYLDTKSLLSTVKESVKPK